VGAGFDDVTLDELYRRRSYKWRAYPPDVLPAFVAEMDFQLAPPVTAAIIEAATTGDCGYAWPTAELGASLSEFAQHRFSWYVDPADVVLIPDVMAGVLELLRLLCEPGDGVVINTPVYPPFFSHIEEARCRVVEAPLALGPRGYELDLEAVEAAFRNGARVYLLCNPHNPTGRVFSRQELQRVAELAERHNVVVLADEIHAPMALPGATHVPFLTLGEPAVSRCVAFASASKAWNIPGLKCAQAVVAADPMRAVVGRLREDVVFRSGHVGVLASIAAYRDGVTWLDDLIAVLDRNRTLMRELLAEFLPGAGYVTPEGGYLGWIDCRGLAVDGEPASVFLDRGRVALRPGVDFGANGMGFVRVTMGTTAEILREIVVRMRAAVA